MARLIAWLPDNRNGYGGAAATPVAAAVRGMASRPIGRMSYAEVLGYEERRHPALFGAAGGGLMVVFEDGDRMRRCARSP